jgi:hypothetical protein
MLSNEYLRLKVFYNMNRNAVLTVAVGTAFTKWFQELVKAGSVLLQDLHSAHPLAVTIPIFCLRQVPEG